MTTVDAALEQAHSALPLPVRRFLVVLGVLTVLCVIVEVFCSVHGHLGAPYNWPLMPNGDPFRDFYLYQPRYEFFHTDRFFEFQGPDYMYPASVASIYRFFYLFPHSTDVFLGALSATFLVALLLFARALRQRNLSLFSLFSLLLVIVLCCYPFAFEFEQANMEWVIWLLVVSGLWAFLTNRSYGAAICFGIVGALKLYPFIFVALFLPRRQYRQFALAFAVLALVTLAGLWLVSPDLAVSWTGTQQGIGRFSTLYVLRYEQLRFDHSLFALVKFAGNLRGRPINPSHLTWMLARYLPLAALAGFAVWVLRIRRLPMVNQVICLTIASILLPPVSFDYTLLHLYAPWAMLVLFSLEAGSRRVSGLSAAFVCFGILLAPETEFIYRGQSFGGQIKAVTLVVLLALALRHRFPSSFDSPAVHA